VVNLFVSLGFGREKNGFGGEREQRNRKFDVMRVSGWLGGVMVR
jgi:hypothetical protein